MIDLLLTMAGSNLAITAMIVLFLAFCVFSWLDVRSNTKAIDATIKKYFDRLEANTQSMRKGVIGIKQTVESTDRYIKGSKKPYWELDDEYTNTNVTPIRAVRR